MMRFFRDLSPVLIGNGVVGFLFAASGPVAIILSVGQAGGLAADVMASWIFAAFFVNGLISIFFCLRYRQPLVFFWTIPGTVLVGPALDHLSFPEVVGAFLATGAVMAVLGMTGVVGRLMRAVPMPIVMGMVAGVFVQFGTGWITAHWDAPLIVLPMTVVFLVLMAVPVAGRLLPPLIGALVAGIIAWGVGPGFAFPADADMTQLARPILQMPAFSLQAMVELVIPLMITVLVVQNGQGFAVLKAAGHEPPINTIAVACGAGSIAAGLLGASSSCLTGPVNAIISSAGRREAHYAAGVTIGILALLFGLAAPIFTTFMLAAPAAFIAALAGLAMLKVLQMSFVTAFAGRFTLGALVTFLITVSDISIFNIGAPFWGLVFGFAASYLLEKRDFEANRN